MAVQSNEAADPEDNSELSSLETPVPLPDELPYIPIGHPDTMMSKESVRRAVEEFHVKPMISSVPLFQKRERRW